MPRVIANLPIGSKVVDPGSSFYGKPIVWKIIGIQHPGYPAGTVTLLSERILTLRSFDAREPNNPNPEVSTGGSNRYSQSNIRQWLNGTGTSWYSEKNEYDESPSSPYVENAQNAYATQPGFLSSLSTKMKAALRDTTLTVAKNTITAGGGSENVSDKVFLLSKTELGLANENGVAEGFPFSLFTSAAHRSARPTTEAIINSEYYTEALSNLASWMYWSRSPVSTTAQNVFSNEMPGLGVTSFASHSGVRPALNVSMNSYVEDEPNELGEYTLLFDKSDLLRTTLSGTFPNFSAAVVSPYKTIRFSVKLNGTVLKDVSNPTFPQQFEIRMDQLSEGKNILEVMTTDDRLLHNVLTTHLNKAYKAYPETQIHHSLGVGNTTDEVMFTLKREVNDSVGGIHRILGGIG